MVASSAAKKVREGLANLRNKLDIIKEQRNRDAEQLAMDLNHYSM